jgi:NCS1 family nucleobase:cation symporter-1
LLASPSTPVERQSSDSLEGVFEAADFRIRGDAHPLAYRFPAYHSSDESYFFDFIMEKVKSTKLADFVDRLAVDSEPGLTNAQLMLNNHDLKPVEPERRQWGPWNFVGFWYV